MVRSSVEKKKRVAIVVFSYYPHDLRIRRAAEAAVQASYRVDVYCLKKADQKRIERASGMTLFRLDIPRSRSKRLNYVLEYLFFLMNVFVRLTVEHLKDPYGLIHVNNMPDVLVFAGLFAKATGAKIILDLHDPTPEVFMTKYGTASRSSSVRLLAALERASIRFADRVLTTNIAFRDLFIKRGCPPRKIDIVMNTPDDAVFAGNHAGPAEPDLADRPFRVVFNGTVVERHGLDCAIDAVLSLRDRIPNIMFDIYGDGDYVGPLCDRINRLGDGTAIAYRGFVHVEELVEIVRRADVGVIPNIRSVFTEINFPVRIFEYLSLDKPIIAPNTTGIRDYFGPGDLLFFDPGNAEDLAEKIHFVYAKPDETREIVGRGRRVYEQHDWRSQKEVLLKTYRDLLFRARPGTAHDHP